MLWPALVIVLGRALGLAIAAPLILIGTRRCTSLRSPSLAPACLTVLAGGALRQVRMSRLCACTYRFSALRRTSHTLWSFAATRMS